jgi:hypothetical protein
MNEFINSIKLNLHNKAISPLFGYYAISWIFWNYKLIFTLFSSLQIDDKFKYINTNILIGDYFYLIPLFVYPFITAIISIFLLLYISNFVYKFHKKKQEELVKIKQDIENKSLLTLEQSIKIRRDIKDIESEYSNHIEEVNVELESLKAEISNKENTINELKEQIKNKPEQLTNKNKETKTESIDITEDEKKILLLFKDDESILASGFKDLVKQTLNIENKIKLDYTIKEYIDKELLYFYEFDKFDAFNEFQEDTYTLTEKAKKLMVENNLVN